MKTVGIIAEYNPFHNGHSYQIAQAREDGADAVLVVMSGSFVQRGEPAITDKWHRTRMALAGGADAVIELPPAFATGSAEVFARGAVALLKASGCVDEILFGAQTEDLSLLEQAAAVLLEEEKLAPALKEALAEGRAYPEALAQAAALQEAALGGLLRDPNNLLAVEYLKAMRRQKAGMKARALLRRGASYGEAALPRNGAASATALRAALRDGEDPEDLADYLPAGTRQELRPLLFPDALSRTLSGKLLALSKDGPEALMAYADVNEPLAHRILAARPYAATFSELTEQIVTKAFSAARVRRALLHIVLDIRKEDQTGLPQAIRLLGMREGSELPAFLKKNAVLPVLTKLADAPPELAAQYTFAQDLYDQLVFFETGQKSAGDYRISPVIYR